MDFSLAIGCVNVVKLMCTHHGGLHLCPWRKDLLTGTAAVMWKLQHSNCSPKASLTDGLEGLHHEHLLKYQKSHKTIFVFIVY
ncbi:hypothetical protein CEXT_268601 [Caerostris extrusa]|uniref:Uncharacterized protein n=1 Tax=Caerostris extrusa TaxID=172846 RepID=A0AAV4Y4D3_CAEEX|nr:hypothetical protein CEXT_268601 [Caerostris extrusa]